MGMRAENLPEAAPTVILGVCGQTVRWMIGDVAVTFICLPPGGEPTEPAEPPVKVVDPIVMRPPATATIIAHDPVLLAEIEVDMSAEPLVLSVERGGEIAFADFADEIASARAEGRQVQVYVSDVELGG